MQNEKEILQNIACHSIYGKGIGAITTKYCGNIFGRYMRESSVLELGPADGIMTEILWEKWGENYTAIDGAYKFVEDLKNRYPGIHAETIIFEDYKPDNKFDNIILGHVLEHVCDPVGILKLCKTWLNEGGIILSAVPNSASLHRQAAVKMGLLEKIDSFSEKDKRHGHKRVFSYESFYECFLKADLSIVARGGYWLKPLSDKQIEKSWDNDLINAYLELGEKYPEIAGEIYIIAK